MRNILLCILLMLLSVSFVCIGQQVSPVFSGTEIYCQMWNPANNYYNQTLVFGNQKDTTSGSTPLYLDYSTIKKGVVNKDSVIIQALNGWGVISINVSTSMVTGVDTVLATLQTSDNGISDWVNNSTVLTLYPSGVNTGCWELLNRYHYFYRVKFVGKSGRATQVQSWIHFIKQSVIQQ